MSWGGSWPPWSGPGLRRWSGSRRTARSPIPGSSGTWGGVTGGAPLRWLDRRCHANREEFTRVIWAAPDAFRCVNVEMDPNLSGLRWTVDYQDDLDFARWAIGRLPEAFGWRQVLMLRQVAPPDMAWRFDPGLRDHDGGRQRSC